MGAFAAQQLAEMLFNGMSVTETADAVGAAIHLLFPQLQSNHGRLTVISHG